MDIRYCLSNDADAVFTLSTERQSKLVNFSMQLSKAKNHYKLIEQEKEVFRTRKITLLRAFWTC